MYNDSMDAPYMLNEDIVLDDTGDSFHIEEFTNWFCSTSELEPLPSEKSSFSSDTSKDDWDPYPAPNTLTTPAPTSKYGEGYDLAYEDGLFEPFPPNQTKEGGFPPLSEFSPLTPPTVKNVFNCEKLSEGKGNKSPSFMLERPVSLFRPLSRSCFQEINARMQHHKRKLNSTHSNAVVTSRRPSSATGHTAQKHFIPSIHSLSDRGSNVLEASRTNSIAIMRKASIEGTRRRLAFDQETQIQLKSNESISHNDGRVTIVCQGGKMTKAAPKGSQSLQLFKENNGRLHIGLGKRKKL